MFFPNYNFQQAVRFSETRTEAWRGLGFMGMLEGDNEQAIMAWKRSQTAVSDLVEFGQKKAKEGRYEGALRWYQVAANLDLATAATALAQQLDELKEYDEATAIWQEALTDYPENPQRLTWWLGLAQSLRNKGEWRRAAEVLELALEEHPDNPQLLTSLGSVLLDSNSDFETVSTVLQRAIMNDSSYAEPYVVMARLLTRENRHEEAFEYYGWAIERDQSVKWWPVARASVARHLGRLSLAKTLLVENIERFPYYAPSYYELSWIHKLLDNPIQAQMAIEKAIDLHNEPPLNYYVRAGEIYSWRNLTDEAQSAYQRAAEIAPEDARVIRGLELLRKVP